jgi:hypothetical protein
MFAFGVFFVHPVVIIAGRLNRQIAIFARSISERCGKTNENVPFTRQQSDHIVRTIVSKQAIDVNSIAL